MDDRQVLRRKSLTVFLLALGQAVARVDLSPAEARSTTQILQDLDQAVVAAIPRSDLDLTEAERLQVLFLKQEFRRVIDGRREVLGLPPLPPDA